MILYKHFLYKPPVIIFMKFIVVSLIYVLTKILLSTFCNKKTLDTVISLDFTLSILLLSFTKFVKINIKKWKSYNFVQFQ